MDTQMDISNETFYPLHSASEVKVIDLLDTNFAQPFNLIESASTPRVLPEGEKMATTSSYAHICSQYIFSLFLVQKHLQ